MLLLIRRTEEHKRSEGHDRLASIDRQAMAEEVILRKGIFVPFDIAWFVCLVSPFETEGLKIPIFTVDALLTKPSSYHNEIKHAKNQTPGNARSRRRSRGWKRKPSSSLSLSRSRRRSRARQPPPPETPPLPDQIRQDGRLYILSLFVRGGVLSHLSLSGAFFYIYTYNKHFMFIHVVLCGHYLKSIHKQTGTDMYYMGWGKVSLLCQ